MNKNLLRVSQTFDNTLGKMVSIKNDAGNGRDIENVKCVDWLPTLWIAVNDNIAGKYKYLANKYVHVSGVSISDTYLFCNF